MEQKKYTDVVRLGHKSTVDVLNVGDNIVIQEKIDGANASFTKEDTLLAFSRNRELDLTNTLGGFYNYIMEKFNGNLNDLNDDFVYFGEWTNPHKVKYEGFEKQFFLFDVYSKSQHKYLGFDVVKSEAAKLNLNLVPVFYEGQYTSFEHLEGFIGKTEINGKIGDKQLGEGIVVKNVDYLDRFGRQLFVKLVVDEFREVQSQKKAKNPTAHMSTPEYILAESVATKARVDKIIYKLKDEGLISGEIDKKDFGMIFKECNIRTWNDVLKEESDSITSEMETEKLHKFISNFATKHAKSYLMEVGAM